MIVTVVEWMPALASRRSSRDMSFTDFGSSLDQRASVGSRPDVSDSVSTTCADPADGIEGVRGAAASATAGDSTANAANPVKQGHGHEHRAEGDHEFNGH